MTKEMMKNKVALITGSGRGIGAETARLLAHEGCRVVLTSRTESEIQQVSDQIIKEHGSAENILVIRSDLEDPASITNLFSAIEKKWGPVEILVNNAAVGFSTDFFELDLPTYEKIQNINVRASFLCSQRMMKKLREAGKPGSIVNLSSLGGIRSTEKFKGTAPYVISKFAVVGLTEALAVEGKPFGIRVNAVAPGAVDTEMLKKAAPHLKTNTKPIDIAKVIVSLCNDESSKSISGSTIEIFSNG